MIKLAKGVGKFRRLHAVHLVLVNVRAATKHLTRLGDASRDGGDGALGITQRARDALSSKNNKTTKTNEDVM